jgi:2-polyprenyl-3-methyl-5-hydroxy-6-metoxy-1,4-benzoquinol methylase
MNIRSTITGVKHTTDAERSPLKKIRCLVPIWGYTYVKKFLEVGLPTWLSDGNLPAIARILPTEFVFLTSREDEIYLRMHPGFMRLSAICEVTIHYVDHFITGNNYSTTITLAYVEAIRATGDEMLDTCFLLLVSDYIFADGSLRTVIERVKAGRNGILVGNFQVVEEEALPWLTDLLQKTPDVLKIAPRELMKWALSHLHPATVANTVDYPMIHNDHTNRLFWRVDNQTLIGRFYLMHMIAIRPELLDFVIGSSCDYSFIPEMCPSNSVEIITDSDDYLVVELQPRNHEAKSLKSGPNKTGKLAKSLSEWTTARHRENSATTVIFHADEIPRSINGAIDKADKFVANVNANLRRKPKRHRRHPYWTGAIAAFKEASGASLTDAEQRQALGLPDPELDQNWLSRWITDYIRFALFGRPPYVRPWHPRYPDYSLVTRNLATAGLDDRSNLLLIADSPTIFTTSFSDGGGRVVRIRSSLMIEQPYEVYEPLHNRFDACLIEVDEQEIANSDQVLDRIAPMMKNGGTVLVSFTNRRNGDATQEFQRSIGYHASRLLRPYARSPIFSFVSGEGPRWRSMDWMLRAARFARDKPLVGVPFLFMVGLPLAAICGGANVVARVKIGIPPRGYVSSALIRTTIDSDLASDAYRYSNSRFLRDRKLVRLGLPKDYRLSRREDVGKAPAVDEMLGGRTKPAAVLSLTKIANKQQMDEPSMTQAKDLSQGTREPQYNRCLEIKDKQGLTSLGLMTNQVWEDDPRRLTFLLARYKFVSKMLSGKKFVGELGCGDAFGTRIVMQTTEKVVTYDFDPVFVEDIRQRQSQRWPVEAHFHDILEAPLPNKHDGIYSLDVIEHIQRAEEDAYLHNLRESLTDDGVLIIGSPSLESQAYASPPSKEGHVNCKSGEELKALLKNYFENVFLFSMNDEVVHTGFTPMAHYLFAVCCQKKTSEAHPA